VPDALRPDIYSDLRQASSQAPIYTLWSDHFEGPTRAPTTAALPILPRHTTLPNLSWIHHLSCRDVASRPRWYESPDQLSAGRSVPAGVRYKRPPPCFDGRKCITGETSRASMAFDHVIRVAYPGLLRSVMIKTAAHC
jgi:hypothetical protein